MCRGADNRKAGHCRRRDTAVPEGDIFGPWGASAPNTAARSDNSPTPQTAARTPQPLGIATPRA